MNKKIRFIGIILAVCCILGMTGCQQTSSGESPKKYYVEAGEVDKNSALSIANSYGNQASYSFSEIKQIRNLFRALDQYDFASRADVSRSDCYDFLVNHGFTPSEAENTLKEFDSRGNGLGLFNVRNSNHAVYIYFEKQ
jgi:hypothetical protein